MPIYVFFVKMSFYRVIITSHLLASTSDARIGGVGKTVEIDESAATILLDTDLGTEAKHTVMSIGLFNHAPVTLSAVALG